MLCESSAVQWDFPQCVCGSLWKTACLSVPELTVESSGFEGVKWLLTALKIKADFGPMATLIESLEMLEMDMACLSCWMLIIGPYLDETSKVALRAIVRSCECDSLPMTPSKIRTGWQTRQRTLLMTPPTRRRKA